MRGNSLNVKIAESGHLPKIILFMAIIFLVFTMTVSTAYCGKVYVPKGTKISIKYKINLSTELKSQPGGSEIFEIAEGQTISGIEVIQPGDEVFCEITKFKKPGLLGGGGEIEIRIDSVQTSLGQNIAVETKILNSKGNNNRMKAILMLPALGYGLLIKGEQAELGKQNETIDLKTSELNSISF